MNRLAWLLVVSWVVVAGCGSDDESVAKKTGAKVGETLTDFASGVGKGIDKKMMVNVELSKELADQGLSSTIAKAGGIDLDRPRDPVRPEKDLHQSSILVYVIAAKPFKGTLIAKALTKDGQEIGRCPADVEFAADDAKYVTFAFHHDMDTQLVAKYAIDAKK
jgi:hypothetical protein